MSETERISKIKEERTPDLIVKVLAKLDDLKNKLESKEPLPHGEQDYDLISQIDDELESILNNWYY